MKLEVNLPLAYRVVRLIDQNTPHPRIAARTGLSEGEVRDVEAWTKEGLPDRAHRELTATETLVLRWLYYWAATEYASGELEPVFGGNTVWEMGDIFDTETFLEVSQAAKALAGKGFLEPLIGTEFPDLLSEEDDDASDTQEHDDASNPGALEIDILDPTTWEGPQSRLVNELLVRGLPDKQDRLVWKLFYQVVRTDTLRIMLDTDDYRAILARAQEEGPAGAGEDAQWPHHGSIYIELREALPEDPEGYTGIVDGFIIREDSGAETRGFVIPSIRHGLLEAIGVGFNLRTGEVTRDDGRRIHGRPITELVRGLAAFVADRNNEFVEMPLSRRVRRTLQRSGQPNPWHVVRRRTAEDDRRDRRSFNNRPTSRGLPRRSPTGATTRTSPAQITAPSRDTGNKERDMTTWAPLPVVYAVIRLIDLNTPYPQIADRTGTTVDYVREIEAWTRAIANSSPQTQGGITATQAMVLWYLLNTAANANRDGRTGGVFGDEDLTGMAWLLGTDTTSEIAEVVESLRGKGALDSLIGTAFQDILPEEDPDEEDEDVPEEPDTQETDSDTVKLSAWEGPSSRLLQEILEQEPSDEHAGLLLYQILRKDTLRVWMNIGDFQAILRQVVAEGPAALAGVREDAQWPHPGPIYIELSEALPEGPMDYLGGVQGFIIDGYIGHDVKEVTFPNPRDDGPGSAMVLLKIRTGEIVGLTGPGMNWDLAIGLARGIVAFITDEHTEIVEMPLSRKARRRLERSGQPNPWHVARRRRAWQAS